MEALHKQRRTHKTITIDVASLEAYELIDNESLHLLQKPTKPWRIQIKTHTTLGVK